MRNFLGLVTFAAAVAVASPASAAQVIHAVGLNAGSGTGVSGNALNRNDGTVKVQITAWNSTTGNLGSSVGRSRGTLDQWDYGLGARYSGDGSHTVDNTGRYDFLVLQFDKAVALNTVTFTSGWDGADSDATISRASVNFAGLGITYKSVGSTFWNAAAPQFAANMWSSNTPNNIFVNGVNVSTRQVNPGLVTSNVWLIAAKIGNNDTYKDAFKVKGFTYFDPNHAAVPEPSTWALLILGMGMTGAAMRRRRRGSLAPA